MKAAGPEPAVLEQGPAQVAQSDQGQRPVVVDPQDMPQRVDQLVDPVTDRRVAELPEERQVLADLGILDRQRVAELAAGDRRAALALVGLELPEVETHPPDDRLGGDLHSRGLGSRFAHQRVSAAEAAAPKRATGKNHAITACDSNAPTVAMVKGRWPASFAAEPSQQPPGLGHATADGGRRPRPGRPGRP